MGATYSRSTPCPRDFACKRCGETVFVDSRDDHRTVFCSAYCEREFWRHQSRYERTKDIAQGHVTDAARDRWALEKEA